MPNSPPAPPVVQRKPPATHAAPPPKAGVVQRKPPLEGAPNNLGWNPGGSQGEIYNRAPRLGISGFNTTFRDKAIEAWKGQKLIVEQKLTQTDAILLARVQSTTTSEPMWVPLAGTGVDHRRSVDEMKDDLYKVAAQIEKEIKAGTFNRNADWRTAYYSLFRFGGYGGSYQHIPWGMQDRSWTGVVKDIGDRYKVFPTTHGAAAYYHDFDNLEPMMSRENSSKGSGGSGATVLPSDSRLAVEHAVAKLYQDIMLVVAQNWGVSTLNKDYVNGIVHNLKQLTAFFEGVVKQDVMATPQVSNSGFDYQSPVRFT